MAYSTIANLATGNVISETWVDGVRTNQEHLFNRNPPLWVPFAANEGGTIGDHTGTVTNGANQTAYVGFRVLAGIASVSAMYAWVVATASTGNVTLDFDCDYGASNEAYNAHTGSSVGNSVALTQNVLTAVAVPSSIYPNLTANDVFGLKITDTGTGRSLRWIALQVDYTWSTT